MKRAAVPIAFLAAFLACPVLAPAAPARKPVVAWRRAPAGAVVQIELAETVSTKTRKAGDSIALRLAAPLIVGGRVLLPAGTPGVGQVIQASRPGLGGKAAKMVLSASYLQLGRTRIPLQGLQLAAGGQGHVGAAQALGLGGIAFAPLGVVAMAVPGGNVTFPAGTVATAKLSASMLLPSQGRASAGDLARARAAARAPAVEGPIGIAPPPRGWGQVVFFRPKSLLGTGQWFNVRESGLALGKLTNGAYFVQLERPGLHIFTAKEEPEFKDSLRMQIDPGETYFIEGVLTKGVVLGAADLTPSDRATFDKAAERLKLSAPLMREAAAAPAPVAPR